MSSEAPTTLKGNESVSDREWLETFMRRRPLQTISYRYQLLQGVRLAVKLLTMLGDSTKSCSEQLRKVERISWMEFMIALKEESMKNDEPIRYGMYNVENIICFNRIC